MEEISVLIAKALLGLGLSYWVYNDSRKKKIKYSNLWLIGTFVFPPIALVYYIYQATAGSNTELTLKQKLDMVGRLLGAVRLLDMLLSDDGQIGWYVDEFFKGNYAFDRSPDSGTGSGPPPPDIVL